MTDRIEQLFRDLKAETLPDVVAPGVGAARATVRRRRGIRLVAGSAVAVAGVLVGITYIPHTVRDQAAAGRPAPDPGQPERLDLAASLLAPQGPDPQIQGSGPISGPVYEGNFGQVAPGQYRVTIVCVGRGVLEARIVQYDDAKAEVVTGLVPCADSPTASELDFTQRRLGRLRLVLNARDGAAGYSAVAYKLSI
jgi:hypothetical protein